MIAVISEVTPNEGKSERVYRLPSRPGITCSSSSAVIGACSSCGLGWVSTSPAHVGMEELAIADAGVTSREIDGRAEFQNPGVSCAATSRPTWTPPLTLMRT
jgi:hypothetical protein